jgi:DNA-binding CsgD family transcriptional regulator
VSSALRTRRLASHIAAEVLAATPDAATLRHSLAQSIDDPALTLVFPRDDGTVIDETGQPADAAGQPAGPLRLPAQGPRLRRAVIGDALRRVVTGECVIDPEIISQLLRRGRERNPLDTLTEREREILSLMAQGYFNDSIRSQLVISLRTVESHVSSVFAKLGIVESPESSRRVLAVLAYLQA